MLFLAGRASAQARVQGTVTDTLGTPIAAASVVLGASRTVTDSAGRFVLTGLRAGPAHLQVRQVGFFAGDFDLLLIADSTLRVAIHLTPGTVRVDSILALATPATEGTQARANGFFERKSARDRGAGSSTFITPEEIARRRPQRVSDLLGAVAGVRLRFINGVAVPYGRDGHCIMNIWVNGTLIEGLYGQSAMNPQSYFRGGASSARPGGGDNEGIDGTINAMEADAVEIYPSPAETPPRFDSLRNQCGTIVKI